LARDVTKEATMVSAYVLVSVEPGKNQAVVSALRDVAGVTQAHACWGRPDIITFIEVDDEKTLADTVLTTMQAIPGVRETETHVVVPV
jgi:DNA-binding Lrp family transcriptional regulator